MVHVKNLKFYRKGTRSVLSPLESDILNILWKQKQMRVCNIYKTLKHKGIALTSIAVMLDRLYKKGVVDRVVETGRGGAHYVYFPRMDETEFKKSIVAKTVDKLIENFGPAAVSYFNERFSKGSKK